MSTRPDVGEAAAAVAAAKEIWARVGSVSLTFPRLELGSRRLRTLSASAEKWIRRWWSARGRPNLDIRIWTRITASARRSNLGVSLLCWFGSPSFVSV